MIGLGSENRTIKLWDTLGWTRSQEQHNKQNPKK